MQSRGRVRSFDETRGFGFIECHTTERNVFVHHSQINGCRMGDNVWFDLVDNNGKWQAKNVCADTSAPAEVSGFNYELPQPPPPPLEDDWDGGISNGVHDRNGRDSFADNSVQRDRDDILKQLIGISTASRAAGGDDVGYRGRAERPRMFVEGLAEGNTPSAGADGSRYSGRWRKQSGSSNDAHSGFGHRSAYSGTIKSYNPEKGFGWIHCPGFKTGDHTGDVYVHATEIGRFGIGDSVGFNIRPTPKGPHAIDLVDDTSAEERLLEGFVKNYQSDKGYGWIECPELLMTLGDHGGKVYVHSSQIKTFRVGEHVRFKTRSTPKGLQAFDLVVGNGSGNWQGDSRRRRVDSWHDDGTRQHQGTIRSYNLEKGYGFIINDDGSGDVFLHSTQKGEFGIGDRILFNIKTGPKGDAGVDLLPLDPAANTLLKLMQDGEEEQGEEVWPFYGIIKCFDREKGYGFISCAASENDIFLHVTELKGFDVGDPVAFELKIHKEKPQAKNLRECDPMLCEPPEGMDMLEEDMLGQASLDANPEEAESETMYHGCIKCFMEDKGFGFIASKESYADFNQDIYLHKTDVKKFSPGDHVSFVVKVDRHGRPRARRLAAWDPPEEDEEEVDPVAYSGTVKSFTTDDTGRGYGFINSAEVTEKYSRDAFLHFKQIKHFKLGDRVIFSVRVNAQGHPQAFNLLDPPPTLAWLSPEEEPVAPVKQHVDVVETDGQEYFGTMKSLSESKGYGFIACDELHTKYGRDVFIPKQQYEGLKMGDKVSFKIQVKRDQPQAIEVVRVSQAEVSAPDAKGEFHGLEGEELDKKLLRACASMRVTSSEDLDKLLDAGANPNIRDVTGQTALQVAALQVRYSERKCRMLISKGADIRAPSSNAAGAQTVLQWARERINAKFATYLEEIDRGGTVECEIAYEKHDGDDF